MVAFQYSRVAQLVRVLACHARGRGVGARHDCENEALKMGNLNEILSLMKRMGETVYSTEQFDMLVDIRPLLIKEGLITTYPTDSVVKAIADHSNLSVNGKWKSGIRGAMDGIETRPSGDIRIERPNGKDDVIVVTLQKNSDAFDNVNAHMLKYGWYNSRTDENNDTIEYSFEKKFGDRFTVRQLRKMTNKIYHVTSSKLRKKIISQGLIPKESKTLGFSNGPRIYFRPDLPSKDMARNFMDLKLDKEPPIAVEVDLDGLNPDQAFFFDPRWKNSIFTFEPIPNTAIKIMEEDELPNIRLNY